MTNLKPNAFCEHCTETAVLIDEGLNYCAQCYINKLEAENNES